VRVDEEHRHTHLPTSVLSSFSFICHWMCEAVASFLATFYNAQVDWNQLQPPIHLQDPLRSSLRAHGSLRLLPAPPTVMCNPAASHRLLHARHGLIFSSLQIRPLNSRAGEGFLPWLQKGSVRQRESCCSADSREKEKQKEDMVAHAYHALLLH